MKWYQKLLLIGVEKPKKAPPVYPDQHWEIDCPRFCVACKGDISVKRYSKFNEQTGEEYVSSCTAQCINPTKPLDNPEIKHTDKIWKYGSGWYDTPLVSAGGITRSSANKSFTSSSIPFFTTTTYDEV